MALVLQAQIIETILQIAKAITENIFDPKTILDKAVVIDIFCVIAIIVAIVAVPIINEAKFITILSPSTKRYTIKLQPKAEEIPRGIE